MLSLIYKKALRHRLFLNKCGSVRWLLSSDHVFFMHALSTARKQENKEIDDRLEHFFREKIEPYPRIEYDERYIEICRAISTWKDKLKNGERVLNGKEVTIRGSILYLRENYLLFSIQDESFLLEVLLQSFFFMIYMLLEQKFSQFVHLEPIKMMQASF